MKKIIISVTTFLIISFFGISATVYNDVGELKTWKSQHVAKDAVQESVSKKNNVLLCEIALTIKMSKDKIIENCVRK